MDSWLELRRDGSLVSGSDAVSAGEVPSGEYPESVESIVETESAYGWVATANSTETSLDR